MTEEALFHEALSRTNPAERAAFLAEHCPDSDLRARVEALLAAHDHSAGVLERPVPAEELRGGTGPFTPSAAPAPAPSLAIGSVVAGKYKLRERLGEGGMGVVYVADQTEPVKRRVALKVIKAGLDSTASLARFEQERQALALMDHPHIAKVLDAGTTDIGQPYFVMELVKGIPITKYCHQEKLTPNERLELFIPVCQAVQHAHQKGVIHRDLKPSNILIGLYDGRPVPKVIDFGVAKTVGPRLGEHSVYTEAGMMVGTLEYMAPEQAELNNLDIDTRADIYALGVVLYELLTGSVPFPRKQLQDAGLAEMLRVIKEVEPPKPSTRLSASGDLPSLAAVRKLEPRRLTKLVRGDLDWITMKCLEKERARRYETANGLASDIQRYLADEAVLAGPPGVSYRLRKFAHKHRRLLATAAAFVLLLAAAAVVGTGLAVWALRAETAAVTARDAEVVQRAEAERQRTVAEGQRAEAVRQRDDATEQRRRTRQALDDMLSDESLSFLTTQKELLPPQRAFLERALTYYREFAGHSATDEEGRDLVGRAQFRVARIYHRLGKNSEAEAGYRTAIAEREKLTADYPAVPEYRSKLAANHNNFGLLLQDLGRWPEAESAYGAAIAAKATLAADYPAVPEYRSSLAVSHSNLGELLRVMGRRPEAEAAHKAALAVREKLAADFPAVPKYRQWLAHSHNNLSMVLAGLVRQSEAEAGYRTAQAMFEKLATDDPAAPDYRLWLSHTRHNLANLFRSQRRQREAEAEYRAALALRERLVADHPAVPEYRQFLALCHTQLSYLLAGLGRRPEAEAEYRTALALREKLATDFPAVPAYVADLGGSYCNLGVLVLERGEPAAALDWFAKAIALLDPARQPNTRSAREFLRNSHWGRASALGKVGRPAEAVPDWERALELDDGPNRTPLLLKRADALARAGAAAQALVAADELATVTDLSATQLYDLARVYALAATKLPTADAEHAAASAVATLRQAAVQGYRDVGHLLQDTDLDALRRRDDFTALLWDLAGGSPRSAGN